MQRHIGEDFVFPLLQVFPLTSEDRARLAFKSRSRATERCQTLSAVGPKFGGGMRRREAAS